MVLIDTWWNVNVIPKTFAKIFDGFNRYMVECESRFWRRAYIISCVLIDTWWNVNLAEAGTSNIIIGVLIDTWWNVNTPEQVQKVKRQPSFNRYMVECESMFLCRAR